MIIKVPCANPCFNNIQLKFKMNLGKKITLRYVQKNSCPNSDRLKNKDKLKNTRMNFRVFLVYSNLWDLRYISRGVAGKIGIALMGGFQKELKQTC